MRYRKKPVEVEAWRLPMSAAESRVFDRDPNIIFKREGGWIVEAIVSTLEGVMTAERGDWIVRGVRGELYPVKPDIFAETYEAME